MARHPVTHPPKIKSVVLVVATLAFTSATLAQTEQSCPAGIDDVTHLAPPLFDESMRENINISADQTRSDQQGNSTFSGNVVIEKHELRITADEASYQADNEQIIIRGNVHVDTPSMAINAEQGVISREEQDSYFKGIEFQVGNSKIRGKAENISADRQSRTLLEQTLITSCPLSDPDWQLGADSITLDYDEEYGSAKSVVLRFMDVPFVYVPYMEFPIGDRRRSGLLVPEIGYSTSRGGELVIPWYWNIAANHDVILAPHYMNRRGTQLDTQYRFLTETTRGQFDGAYLHEDEQTQEERYQLQYQQHTRFMESLAMDIDIQDVSDTDYFNDFSSNLSTSSTTHLTRDLKLNYSTQNWRAHMLAQTYETLDTTILTADRPYRRLPQIQLEGEQPLGDAGLSFTLDSEWVNFDHEDDAVVTGTRFNIRPGLRWLAEGSFWFIDPTIKFSHTQYQVEDANGVAQELDDRSLSMSSLDAGLFFERELDNGIIHTLEPRLYYLNVPYRDQSLLPNFDTRLSIFSTALLFRDNRFDGGDRIGDANQLTLALSSRLISSSTGDEYLRASIGQIRYFEDRLVSLDGSTEERNRSDLMAELGLSLGHWGLNAYTQWNSELNQSQRGNFLLHYQSDQEHIFNLGLRSDRSINNEIRQTDVSFLVPLSNRVNTFARWNYSLESDRSIETIAGLSYDSCCWSVQLLGQRRLTFNNTADEYDNAIMVQLVLKELGSVSGDKVSTTLEHAILGYSKD